jgi:tyrosyl-tRNA synthetase
MSKPITDEKQIDQVLSRGVEMVYPTKEELKKKLMSGERIKLYCGFDPTGPTLHLGHGNQIRKLAEFQKLGHEVVFLMGDFTAMIGDPTDKSAARQQLTRKQVLENLKNYQKQAGAILDFKGKNAAKVEFNSKWLGKMKFEDVLDLASKFTVQRMIERDMFQDRIADAKPIYVHEFMYPMMQGYDSVALDVDLELGGSDQTFNMLAGRDLMKTLKQKEKFVLTLRLLTDPTGKKMGKTEGNMVSLDQSAEDMFGKVMSWPDEMISLSFEICTDIAMSEIEKKSKAMKDGANPRDFKLQLAEEIVRIYKGDTEAAKAKESFINFFQKKEGPEKIETVNVKSNKLVDIMVESGLVDSNSQAKRDIKQGGVKVNEKVIDDINAELDAGENIIQKGKRHFVKVKKN